MIDWVEHGTEPPGDTGFDTTDDGAIVLRDGGLGAVVASSPSCRHRERQGTGRRHAGEEFVLVADISAPPGGGTIVAVEWDLDGRGTALVTEDGVDGTRSTMRVRQGMRGSKRPARTSRRPGHRPP